MFLCLLAHFFASLQVEIKVPMNFIMTTRTTSSRHMNTGSYCWTILTVIGKSALKVKYGLG